MVKRPETARFMPGVWVFPGGAVDSEDAAPPDVFVNQAPEDWKVAAIREIAEETGIWLTDNGTEVRDPSASVLADVADAGLKLDADRLVYFANWITPRVFPIRFDTRFFLAAVEDSVMGTVDGDELVDLAWVEPADALRREGNGSWEIAFPTRQTLKFLAGAASAASLVDEVRRLVRIPSIEPRLRVSESEATILLPDDPGFEAAGPEQDDPTILKRLEDLVRLGGTLPAEFRMRS